jgi:hypothetical protein
MSEKQTHQIDTAKKFISGLKRHNIDANLQVGFRPDNGSDLVLVWGMRGARTVRPSLKKDFLLMERSYLEDRFEWISLGYNGLNGKGEFYNKGMSDDRWKKHFDDGRIKEWNPTGDHILLTTQIRGDNSIKHLNVNYQKIINDIKQNTDLPVYVRDHPQRKNTWGTLRADGVAPSNIPIAEAAAKAKVVVTINSNSGVDSILAGTPVVNFDNGSMVWDLAMKNLSDLENPLTPDRTQWCNDIAYAQWLPYEIENGDAWEHLKQRYY